MNHSPISIRAYAKLNLCLHIHGRRADGYHLLQMVNTRVDLFDTLTLEIIDSPVVDIEATSSSLDLSLHPEITNPEKNLIGKAYELMKKRYQLKTGLRVKLQKDIPIGGGMGGGSSDGAEILKFLFRLVMPREVSAPAELALQLGADVPYFLQGGLALVEGIGERVTQLECSYIDGYPVILIIPAEGTSTKAVYEEYASQNFLLTEGKGDTKLFLKEWPLHIENDLESSILKVAPRLQPILSELRGIQMAKASFSGSGSTLFVVPRLPESISKLEQTVKGCLLGTGARAISTRLNAAPTAA